MLDLDLILIELGQFGRYQLINHVLLVFPIVFSVYYSMSYVFTAGDIAYRCAIPECEYNNTYDFNPDWLKNAVPLNTDGNPVQCLRYKPVTDGFANENCTVNDFFTNQTIGCNEYIFKSDEKTIVTDFELYCDNNKWKWTLIGTINNVGQFLGMPVAGYVSDRYGRKFMLITSIMLSTIVGVLRSFSTNYITFLVLELLDATVATGIYSASFILGAEIVGPEKRELGSAILSSAYTLGEVYMALVVWYFQDWRKVLRVLYAPGVFFLIYIWYLPESIRWLISKSKVDNVRNIIENIAKTNGKPITGDIENKMRKFEEKPIIIEKALTDNKSQTPFKEVFTSYKMVLRIINCSFCWVTHTFVFYGLSLNSVAVAGDKYMNFMLVSLAELPGYAAALFTMDQIGRRISLSSALIISGVACLAFYFIPTDMAMIRLILFLTGKAAITGSFMILYVYTAEMFPTTLRHSLLGTCSMFGRIGSMVAPQTPLLAMIIEPLLIFGGISITAGLLSLFFPETLNTPLPDTVQEAIEMGRKKLPETSIKS